MSADVEALRGALGRLTRAAMPPGKLPSERALKDSASLSALLDELATLRRERDAAREALRKAHLIIDEARDEAVAMMDSRAGYTVEFAHDPAGHRADYDEAARRIIAKVAALESSDGR